MLGSQPIGQLAGEKIGELLCVQGLGDKTFGTRLITHQHVRPGKFVRINQHRNVMRRAIQTQTAYYGKAIELGQLEIEHHQQGCPFLAPNESGQCGISTYDHLQIELGAACLRSLARQFNISGIIVNEQNSVAYLSLFHQGSPLWR
jgi:hypothetical protein